MRRALVIALLALLALAAPAAAKTFDNPKGSITVAEHSTFNIALDSRAGTGFTWKVTKKPSAERVKYVSSKTTKASRPGGPTQQVLKFDALDSGTTAMTLSYVAPGRKGRASKTLDLTVKVKKT
jgi:predicted secreted protein